MKTIKYWKIRVCECGEIPILATSVFKDKMRFICVCGAKTKYCYSKEESFEAWNNQEVE